jgi:hypothetical protein
MLRHFVGAKKNHRHVPAVTFPQDSIIVDIHLAESRAVLAKKRRNRRLGLFAQMTAWPSVQRHVAWTGGSQARVLSV